MSLSLTILSTRDRNELMKGGGLKGAGIPRDRRTGKVPIRYGSTTAWDGLVAKHVAEDGDDEDVFLSRSPNLKPRHLPLVLHKETSSNAACTSAAELPAIKVNHYLNGPRNTPVPRGD